MRKRLLSVCALLCVCGLVCAYNPPADGELLYQLVTPQILSNGASAAGGALPYTTAEHTAINPALTAGEQRVVVNLGATGLLGPDSDPVFGLAGHAGLVIPTKYGVFTGMLQSVTTKFQLMNFGSSATIRGGFAKDITDSIYVGASLATTFGKSFSAFGDLGVLWNKGKISKLPWLKDVRIGFSLTELGLPYKNPEADGLFDRAVSGFPGWVTPRAGIAGTVLSAEKLTAGVSADISLPSFQNVVADFGLQLLAFDMIRIKTGWEFNLCETLAGTATYLPDVAISVKIGFSSKKDDGFLTEHGWQQSELVPSVGYRYLDDGVSAYSAGISAHLGLKDTEAPVIELWSEEEAADE